MKKKILIASIFATLMLLVPFSSVVGESNIELSKNSKSIEKNNVIPTGVFVSSLKNLVSYISYRFSYNAQIVALCNLILQRLNSNILDSICEFIKNLYENLINSNVTMPEGLLLITLAIIVSVYGLLCGILNPPGTLTSVLMPNIVITNKTQNSKVKCPCMEQ